MPTSERFPDLAAAAESLTAATEISMACHVGPDGDALGSMLAVAWAATQAGKKVFASFGPPFLTVPGLRFLPLELLVEPDLVPDSPALMVTFDSGNLDRLSQLAGPASRAQTLIVVDHHSAGSGGFGHLNLIDPKAAATAEIAYLLLEAAGWNLDETMATCLLTGLVTDTGRFQYSNTTPDTLRLAATLVELGARPEVIGQHVYEEAAFGFLKAAGRVMERAVLEVELELVWSVLYRSDLEEAGIDLGDTDPLIDLIRLPIESGAAMLLKEHGPGLFKGSLRSRGAIDVGSVAQSLGGGGHHNAAGFTFNGAVEEVVAAVRVLLSG